MLANTFDNGLLLLIDPPRSTQLGRKFPSVHYVAQERTAVYKPTTGRRYRFTQNEEKISGVLSSEQQEEFVTTYSSYQHCFHAKHM